MKQLLKLLLAASLLLSACSSRAEPDNVGKQIPALKLNYASNAVVPEGKPLLLEFWATWCPPCRTSIPHLNDLYSKFKDKGLVVIGVTDEDAATVEKFTQKIPMNYSVAVGDETLGGHFGVRSIPHALLVNREGKITWEGHPMELSEAEIEKILK